VKPQIQIRMFIEMIYMDRILKQRTEKSNKN